MAKITKEAALLYHSQGKPGKIEVVPTKPYSTQTDLSLAYSPGVAEPCLEIEKNPQDAYKYTAKGIDTLQQVESHLLMRHYDGLLKSGRIKGRSGNVAAY